MARPANAKFYDPEDANSKVALEARCDIMYTVLSNEPGVWRGFVKLISSLGQTLPFYTDWRRFDGIAMGVEFLAQWLEQRDYYIKSNEAAREFNRIAEAQGMDYRDELYPEQKIQEMNRVIGESFLPTAKTMAGL